MGTAEVDSKQAWLIVVAAVISMFTLFGVAYSFGAFFDSMAEEFDTGSGATAFAFSVTIAVSFVFGRWTGSWGDRVGPRPLLLAAAVSFAAGLLTTTMVPNLYLGYLTYGFGVGFAMALGYVPLVSAVAGWFDTKRSTATGIAVAGIGLGTVVGSPLAATLIDATSWRTTYVIFAIGGASLLLAAAAIARPSPGVSGPTDLPAIRDLAKSSDFRVLYAATIFISLGLFVPFVFIASYAEERGTSAFWASALIGILGGSSVLGRLGLGVIADRLGAVRLFRMAVVTIAVSHLIWLTAGDRYWQLLVYVIVFGAGYGGFIALSPVIVAERFGLGSLGGVLGTLYTSAAFGVLAGPPVAGVFRDQFGYSTAISFAAAATFVAVLILMPLQSQRGFISREAPSTLCASDPAEPHHRRPAP